MHIDCPLRQAAMTSPDSAALRFGSDLVSYSALDIAVNQLAANLLRSGIAADTRVGILADNSPDYVQLLMALLRIGAVAVPLNPRLTPNDWHNRLQEAAVNLVVCGEDLQEQLGTARPSLSIDALAVAGQASRPTPLSPILLNSDQLATIIFTSGSGGAAKGVMLTLGNHISNAVGSNDNIPLSSGDTWLLSLPLCHVGGLGILFRCLLARAAMYLVNRFEPAQVIDLVDRGEITHLSLVPTMLLDLLRVRGHRSLPASLKAILLSGAPTPPALLEQILRLKLPIVTSYGLSEGASQVTATRIGDTPAHLATNGRPLRYREVRIADDDRRDCATGTIGEILVRGVVMFRGYLNEPPREPAAWFATGDLGSLSEDGYLTVTGRKDRMFISGGENIYPEEIERCAQLLSSVREAVCIAVPHERWGMRPALVVETAAGSPLDLDALRQHLAHQLPRFKQPDKIIFVEKLPRTGIDKVDRARVAQILAKS